MIQIYGFVMCFENNIVVNFLDVFLLLMIN